MADVFTPLEALLACPCDQHGRLNRDAATWVSVCCGQKFTLQGGVLVLLPTEG